MNLYKALCLVFLLSISLGCKSEPKKSEKIEVLTVVDAAVPVEESLDLMTAKYCGTHGVAAGKVFNKTSRACECKHGSYDEKIGKCIEKKSETILPDRDVPMDNHGPTAEEREEDNPSAEEVAQALKDAPEHVKNWRKHGWKAARYSLSEYLVTFGFTPKQLKISQEEADRILNE